MIYILSHWTFINRPIV